MAQQTINIGASPNDGTGTPLRTSFDYTNQNFTELYTALGGGVGLPGATTQVIFNDGGTNLAGDAGLVYNKTTDALTVAGLVTAGSATITGDLTVDTNVLKVDTTNNRVGIGTASPATALQVVGEIRSSADISNSSDTIIYSFSGGTAGSVRAGLQLIGSTPEIRVYLSSATALTINSTSNLVLKGGTAAADGVGLTFPAAQVASSDANCLDDYEEGTWAGTLTGGTTNPTIAVTATGRYTKIGRVVTVQIYFDNVNTLGASGLIGITGLPFTNNASVGSTGSPNFYNIATFTGSPFLSLGVNQSFLSCYSNISNSAFGNVTHNASASTNYLTASITYTVA